MEEQIIPEDRAQPVHLGHGPSRQALCGGEGPHVRIDTFQPERIADYCRDCVFIARREAHPLNGIGMDWSVIEAGESNAARRYGG